MKGKYAREYALTCSPLDSWRFNGLKKDISMRHRRIWVRKVFPGDLITSKGKIIRWKVVEDEETGNLYLGFIEELDHSAGFRHGKVSIYAFGWNFRSDSLQDLILIRIKTSNLGIIDVSEIK